MKQSKRQSYHHGNLRAALLTAARALLDAEGPDGVTIRAVARRAGVSHSAPVNHFPDRKALLTALAASLFEELAEAIAAAPGSTPLERIKSTGAALIDYGLSNPNRYRLLWRRDLVDNEDVSLQRVMDGIYDRLVADLRDADKRRNRPFDADTYALGLWSLAHGYVSMRLDGNFEAHKDTVTGQPRAAAMIDAFLAPLTGKR